MENRKASEVPGLLPRTGPPPATCGPHASKCGARFRGRRANATGHHRPQKTQTPTLNIIQVNICGLRNKKTDLAKILNDHKVHVALLQETIHQNSDTHITGYTSYPCKCTDCRGIITYIRNDIAGTVIHPTEPRATDVQHITIWHAGRKFTLYNVYNPPWNSINIPDLQESNYSKTILCGDFNGHSPLWGYTDYNNTGKYIEELCQSSNLSPLQNSETTPTLFHRTHNTASRPDLTIVSSDIESQCSMTTLRDVGSDHRPILTTISAPCKLEHRRRTR